MTLNVTPGSYPMDLDEGADVLDGVLSSGGIFILYKVCEETEEHARLCRCMRY
jgi:hypothetical protein